MLSKAQAKYIRVAPRKARLVIDLIKGKSVEDAEFVLENANKGAARPILKVLRSAFANANNEREEKLIAKNVIVSKIKIDGGPTMRRFRAATMGRAAIIRHRTSHIYVELDHAKEKMKSKAGKE